MARYCRNANATTQAFLSGAIALRSVEGRSGVANTTGWNATSKISHYIALLSSIGTAAIPHIGGFISAPIKVMDAFLSAYSSYDFNRIHWAVSEIVKKDEVESFSDALSRGAAFMTARTLPVKRSWLQRTFVDEPAYRAQQFSGTASGISKEEKMEEVLASGQMSKVIMDLAFGKAMGVPEAEAAHQLRRMTTDQKVEVALRHLCSLEGIEFKAHLFVYRPSLNERSTLSVKGLTRVALDTTHDALESKEHFERELANRDRKISKLEEAVETLKQKHWKLKKVVRKLDPELEYSAGEEDFLFGKGVGVPKNLEAASVWVSKDAKQAYGEAAELALREQAAKALCNKGDELRKFNDLRGAIAAYDAVDTRFGEAKELALRELVAMALYYKGVVLGKLNDLGEAIKAYEAVDTRFGEAKEPVLRERVAKALCNKGNALRKFNDLRGAITVYEAVDTRFGEVKEPALRELVAEALLNKGVALGKLGHRNKAIEAYVAVDTRFGEETELALRDLVAKARRNKGVAFS
jgi:tetratricopeptide (TPR) repeat protein